MCWVVFMKGIQGYLIYCMHRLSLESQFWDILKQDHESEIRSYQKCIPQLSCNCRIAKSKPPPSSSIQNDSVGSVGMRSNDRARRQWQNSDQPDYPSTDRSNQKSEPLNQGPNFRPQHGSSSPRQPSPRTRQNTEFSDDRAEFKSATISRETMPQQSNSFIRRESDESGRYQQPRFTERTRDSTPRDGQQRRNYDDRTRTQDSRTSTFRPAQGYDQNFAFRDKRDSFDRGFRENREQSPEKGRNFQTSQGTDFRGRNTEAFARTPRPGYRGSQTGRQSFVKKDIRQQDSNFRRDSHSFESQDGRYKSPNGARSEQNRPQSSNRDSNPRASNAQVQGQDNNNRFRESNYRSQESRRPGGQYSADVDQWQNTASRENHTFRENLNPQQSNFDVTSGWVICCFCPVLTS